jgi:hypothetical protein
LTNEPRHLIGKLMLSVGGQTVTHCEPPSHDIHSGSLQPGRTGLIQGAGR